MIWELMTDNWQDDEDENELEQIRGNNIDEDKYWVILGMEYKFSDNLLKNLQAPCHQPECESRKNKWLSHNYATLPGNVDI